ncbi:predicted protein [Streptomyces sviceus ATCC 29083]|uniref:Uncharacterized protein n=1 Tax=Streptomyces sviceus (strain ATCC 29083 / DSM 924 / JCM 4929 / NBRC 13980 / NCIMB 11184 / NRRL 5439 / UC 5370) TaxID=463191 RepID=D6XB34_STRX2|nr:predicted protein [Streptomyces sviceus ATCC 29083]
MTGVVARGVHVIRPGSSARCLPHYRVFTVMALALHRAGGDCQSPRALMES